MTSFSTAAANDRCPTPDVGITPSRVTNQVQSQDQHAVYYDPSIIGNAAFPLLRGESLASFSLYTLATTDNLLLWPRPHHEHNDPSATDFATSVSARRSSIIINAIDAALKVVDDLEGPTATDAGGILPQTEEDRHCQMQSSGLLSVTIRDSSGKKSMPVLERNIDAHDPRQ